METLLLSDLLKIGISYFRLDSTNAIFFNDGTKMWSQYREGYNGEGSSWDDMDLLCLRDGKCYNILDDVYKNLKSNEQSAIYPSFRKRQ